MKYFILSILLFPVLLYSQIPEFHLNFEGNGQDSSGNAFPCKVVDSTFSTAHVDGAKSWIATYGEIWESKSTYNTGNTWSIVMNIYYSADENNHSIFTNMSDAFNSEGFNIYIDADFDRVAGMTRDASLNEAAWNAASSTLTKNAWNHIVVISDGQYWRVYVNNVKLELADSTAQSDYVTTAKIAIGDETTGTGDYGWNSDAYFDNIHFYKYELSTIQVDSTYDRRAISTFQLGEASSAPSEYSPVPGRDVRIYDRSVAERIPYNRTNNMVYFNRKVHIPVVSDTLDFYFYEDFELANSSTLSTITSAIDFLPFHAMQYQQENQTIVNVGGVRGNVWDSELSYNTIYNMAISISLADTASELYFEYDLYVDADYDPIGTGGGGDGKIGGGFEGGNSEKSAAEYGDCSLIDTVTINGRGFFFHTARGRTALLFPYGYAQDVSTGPWQNCADGISPDDAGYVPFSTMRGSWHRVTHRIFTGDIGKYNGFTENYLDGVLVSRYGNLKMRSVTPGADYGKIESLMLLHMAGGGMASASSQDQSVRFDRLVAYRYQPGAVNFKYGIPRSIGDEIPIVYQPGSYRRASMHPDETYTASADTIYTAGNGKSYLSWDAYNDEVCTKIINKTGTINYSFVREEFGYRPDTQAAAYWVKVYSGVGAGKTLVATYGRTQYSDDSSTGWTDPSGNYTVTGPVTIEIHTGYTSGNENGIAIKYW